MDSEKVSLTARAKSELQNFNPSDQTMVAGVLDFLADDGLRQRGRIDLHLASVFGEVVWGFTGGRLFIAFVETVADDGDDHVVVLHMALQSPFRPLLRPFDSEPDL